MVVLTVSGGCVFGTWTVLTVLNVLRGCDLGVWTVFTVLTVYSRGLCFWTVLTGCVMCIFCSTVGVGVGSRLKIPF